ncbi:sulfotransferase, partial [Candidatus Marinimicrobia bacterium]|nr:sulfotransferase [Candidatus Neomarinimicrobiota bacterium]
MKPNLFLLGAQKSGSTFLRYSLNQHPDISINSLEDKTFEDPEYKQYNGDFRHLDKKTEKFFYGIARPDYFGELKYMKRIKKYSPDSKIIIVLRDPTLRAISSYYHYMKYGIIPAKHPNYL